MKQIIIFSQCLMCAALLHAQEPVTPVTHSTDQNSTVISGTEVKSVAEAPPAAPSKSEYAEKYKGIAIAEMDRVGIPASIKLAQAILESSSGESDLAKEANNHFGVKCAGNWTGKTYHKKDDEYNDKNEKVESCFRKYSKPEESFYDHSEFLRDPRKYYRYGFLFSLDKRDYRAWARGLESSGYATGAGYADKLIDLIERYKLYQYDDPEIQAMNSGSMNDGKDKDKDKDSKDNKDSKTNPIPPRVGRINDVKVVIANQGETVDEIANTFRLNAQKVADYNERRYTPGKPLDVGTRIFIQKKKTKWRGRAKHHFVREGQTMFEISQQYGVQLNELLKKNGLRPGLEPATGERIRVRGRRKSDEVVRLRETTTTPSGGTKPATNKPATSTPTVGDELFEIGGDPAPANPSGGTKPSTSPSKPSTSPGSGNYPQDPTPASSGNTNTKPQTTPTTPPVVTPPAVPGTVPAGYHLVVKGDTLFSLSRKYNITVAKLKALNGITNDAIQIGQKLRVQ